ncbi:MAG TPA: PP2C family protein-serine/threonine phosphatase [Candidatus Babeliales bacterium]|nr:PP2C family protein-serine/threonine phosphatase [Candidatus Babeliales bacterium]
MKVGVVGLLLLLNVSLSYGCEQQLASAIGVYSDRGRRPTQEDTWHHEVINGGNFFAVCDGHSGPEIAECAKQKLAVFFKDAFGSVEERMKKAFLRLDNDDCVKLHKKCGSTASVVFINKNTAHFAHVGDSRVVLEKSGTVAFATRDHKPNRPDELDRIVNLGGNISDLNGTWRVEYYLAMSRAIGDWFIKKYIIADPEYTEKELTSENRYLILATDGLWDVMSNEEAVQGLKDRAQKCPSAKDLAKHLGSVAAEMSDENITKDNITVIVVDLLLLASGGNQ